LISSIKIPTYVSNENSYLENKEVKGIKGTFPIDTLGAIIAA
jgi:hypothetical protein